MTDTTTENVMSWVKELVDPCNHSSKVELGEVLFALVTERDALLAIFKNENPLNRQMRVTGLEWKRRTEKAEAERDALLDALTDIAKQKRTDEQDTEYDVEHSDFEGGYDTCVNVARAAIAMSRALKSAGVE